MKKILWLVCSLTIIAGVCSALLAYVNVITAGPIKEIKVKQANEAALAVMPAAVETVEKSSTPAGELFIGKDRSGRVAGFAITGMDPGGYGGDIVLMVGFDIESKLVSYKALQATETPGLGTKLSSPEFKGQFSGKSADKPLAVKQDGGEIEAITSATITSRAVCRALGDAAKRLKLANTGR